MKNNTARSFKWGSKIAKVRIKFLRKVQLLLIRIRNRLLGLDRLVLDIEALSNRIDEEARKNEIITSAIEEEIIRENTATKECASKMLDNLKYELATDLYNTNKPKILNIQETIEELSKKKVSISRYGDAEFEIMMGRSVPFQEYNEILAKALVKIIRTKEQKIIIGLNYCYWNSLENFRAFTKFFVRTNIVERRPLYEEFIDFDKQYYAAECTLAYANYASGFDFERHFANIKRLFDNREIIIISGTDISTNFLLEGAKSVSLIKAPPKNAYSKYKELLKKAEGVGKDKLILICLGPTATVMAYDLAIKGFQAFDAGHLFEDYDWYKEDKIKGRTEIEAFFAPPSDKS